MSNIFCHFFEYSVQQRHSTSIGYFCLSDGKCHAIGMKDLLLGKDFNDFYHEVYEPLLNLLILLKKKNKDEA